MFKNLINIKALLFIGCICIGKMQLISQTNTPQPGNQVGTGSAVVNPLPAAYSSSAPVNLVRTWVPQKPYSTVMDLFTDDGDINSVQHTTSYTDGLGRPIQTVNWQAAPGGKDMTSMVTYDGFGREQFQYLPYTSPGSDGNLKLDPFGEQKTFYSATYLTEQPAYKNESYYYGHTNFEASPLNRVTSAFSPGNSWVGSEGSANPRSNRVQYLVNTGSSLDNVKEWTIGFSALTYANEDGSTNVPTVSQVYPAGALMKTVAIDENNKVVVKYTDILGHTVLEKVQADGSIAADYSGYQGFLCTYNVYDNLGRLRFAITPKAVALMVTNNSFTLTADMVNELCFRYEYDSRQRMIGKRLPGAGWVYIVYDQFDRPVFMQDANLRKSNLWDEVLYDNLNRQVETGVLYFAGVPTGLQINSTQTTSTINSNLVPSVQPNLYIDMRQVGITQYTASVDITFDDGFNTELNADFSAQIVAANGASFSNTVVTTSNPVPPGCSGCTFTPLTIRNYDGYSTTKNFIDYSSKVDKGLNPYADALPTSKTALTYGLLTSSRVRVLEDINNVSIGGWMENVTYYDDLGRVIQNQADNYKAGIDIETVLYDFTSATLCTYEVHNNPSANVTNFGVKTNFNYDAVGRLLNVVKTLSGALVPGSQTSAKTIVQYTYDALGQVRRKQAGTNASSGSLEDDAYSYNIKGQLKSINWNYGVNPTISNIGIQNNKWFAMDLSYDWGYATNQYNGNIAGQRWVNAGDVAERSFGYGYDAANRFLFADFKQKFGSTWDVNDPVTTNGALNIDYTTKIGDGISSQTYDANGNIKQMQHKGLALNASLPIDNLLYNYMKVLNGVENSSGVETNKLAYITDNGTQPAAILGDFIKKNIAGGDDYGYDKAGNLLTDLNKKLYSAGATVGYNQAGGAITYNFLGLPCQIKTADASTNNPSQSVVYIYDAVGNKLEKRTTNEVTAAKTITSYSGSFIYENNVLQFFSQEEGRVRYTANMPSPSFVYDYFIQDHLGNTRVILSEEQRADNYTWASLEDGSTSNEQKYYNIPSRVLTAGITNYPLDGTTSPNQYTQQLKASGTTPAIGTSMILKVMAGDKINVKVNCWYKTNGVGLSPIGSPAVTGIIDALALAAKGVPAASGGKLVTSQITPTSMSTQVGSFLSNRNTNNYITGRPKAFLNVVLLDEQLRPVLTNDANNSYFVQVPVESAFYKNGVTTNTNPDNQVIPISIPLNRLMTKSGYLFVYVSNEDQNINVYFDNLQVGHIRGPLLETDDYYPFGLKMAGISSAAMPVMTNKYLYQAPYSEFEAATGYNEFDLRHYDPQLGRWIAADPDDQFPGPYTGMGNNPINSVDRDGGWSFGLTGATIGAAVGMGAAYFIVKNNPHMNGWLKGLIETGLPLLGSGIGYGLFESAAATGSYVDNNRSNGSSDPFQNFVSWYKGLAGFPGAETGSSDYLNTPALAPNIWGSWGSFSLPSPFEWVDDVKLGPWQDVLQQTMYLVTAGYPNKQPGDIPLTRTTTTHPYNTWMGTYVEINDQATFTVPNEDKLNRTVIRPKIEKASITKNGSQWTYSYSKLSPLYVGPETSMQSPFAPPVPYEYRIKIQPQTRRQIPIKRLKFLKWKTLIQK